MKFLKVIKAIVWLSIVIALITGLSLYILNYTSLLNTGIKAYIDDQANLDISNKICEKYCNRNILLLEENDITNFIAENFYQLKLKDIKYEFPRTMHVYLSSRQKETIVKAKNGIFEVDKDFYVFNKVEGGSYNIEYDNELTLGQTVSDDILKTGIKLSGGNYIINIKDNKSTIELDDKIVVRLPEDLNSVKEAAEALNKIFKEVSLNSSGLKEVDLRYSKPVLIY